MAPKKRPAKIKPAVAVPAVEIEHASTAAVVSSNGLNGHSEVVDDPNPPGVKKIQVQRKWAFDDGGNAHVHGVTLPLAYISGNFDRLDHRGARNAPEQPHTQDDLVYKSAMGVVSGLLQPFLMAAMGMFMSGSTLQVFSAIPLGMAFYTFGSKLVYIQQAFARYRGSKVDLTIPKLLFVLVNLLGLALAVYRCHTYGLLPTSKFDWLPPADVKRAVEFSAGSLYSSGVS